MLGIWACFRGDSAQSAPGEKTGGAAFYIQIRYCLIASGHFSRSELMEITNSIFSRSA